MDESPAITHRNTSAGIAALIGDIAGGESAAMTELYARTSSKMYGIAVRLLGDQGAAEDVVQAARRSGMDHTPHDRRTFLGRAGALVAVSFLAFRTPSAAAKGFAVTKSSAEWRRILGPQRYHILREAGTERPFASPLNKEHRTGIFACAGCGQRLFASSTKFDSGTGWPSFYRPLKGAVVTRSDTALGMVRNEVLCTRCGGHLGHVFDDGPRPTGLRYCMNGLAMRFLPD